MNLNFEKILSWFPPNTRNTAPDSEHRSEASSASAENASISQEGLPAIRNPRAGAGSASRLMKQSQMQTAEADMEKVQRFLHTLPPQTVLALQKMELGENIMLSSASPQSNSVEIDFLREYCRINGKPLIETKLNIELLRILTGEKNAINLLDGQHQNSDLESFVSQITEYTDHAPSPLILLDDTEKGLINSDGEIERLLKIFWNPDRNQNVKLSIQDLGYINLDTSKWTFALLIKSDRQVPMPLARRLPIIPLTPQERGS